MHPSSKQPLTSIALVGLLSSAIVVAVLARVASAGAMPSMTAGPAGFVTITATVGLGPKAIGINPNTGYVYVANSGEGSVTILQGTSVVTTVGTGNSPRSVGVNPATGYIYVGNYVGNDVAILKDTAYVTGSGSIAQPNVIGVNLVTGYAYVGSRFFNSITVFSATKTITTVSLGGSGPNNYPLDIQINPDTGRVYATTNDPLPKLKVISGTQVIATIPITTVGRIGINTSTGYVYLTDGNNGTLPGNVAIVSDTTVIGEIPVGMNPFAIAVDSARDYVYVSNRTDNTVSVIHGTSVITTVAVGTEPYAIAVDPVTGFAYVTHFLDTDVYVLRGSEVITKLKSEMGAHSIVVNPVTRWVYVANEYSNSVSIFLDQLPNRVFLPVVMRLP